MPTIRPVRRFPLPFLFLLLSFLLSSCGGDSDSSSGAGGSDQDSSGPTTVSGNISQIVISSGAGLQPESAGGMLARIARWVSTPAHAQSTGLADIRVFGGGQVTTTDADGNFVLDDVAPSDNFMLIFEPPIVDQDIVLPIGAVPGGARVRVVDVTLDLGLGLANVEGVEIQSSDSADSD